MCYENIETPEPRNRTVKRGNSEYNVLFLESSFNGYITENNSAYMVADKDDNIICHLWKNALIHNDLELAQSVD